MNQSAAMKKNAGIWQGIKFLQKIKEEKKSPTSRGNIKSMKLSPRREESDFLFKLAQSAEEMLPQAPCTAPLVKEQPLMMSTAKGSPLPDQD